MRLYLLRSHSKMVEASLSQLIDNDRAALAEDLVSSQELALYPGETATPILPRLEGATIVGVVAFFRHPNGPSWRAMRALAAPNPDHCHGTLNGKPVGTLLYRFNLEENRVEVR